MISVGFLGQSFRQILIYFLFFMHQDHMVFIAISKVHILVYERDFLLFPKIFCKPWDSKANCEKIEFRPFFRPY